MSSVPHSPLIQNGKKEAIDLEKSRSKRISPRRIALSVLNRVHRTDAYAEILLDYQLSKHSVLDRRDRAFVTEIVYGVLRWRKRIDWVLAQFSQHDLRRIRPLLLNLLRVGLYQLLFMKKVPPFAAINESVELAKEVGLGHASSFVNAVLRKIQRDADSVKFLQRSGDPVEHLSIVYSHPTWLVQEWVRRWGVEEIKALCQANNMEAPIILRANTLRITREELMKEMADGCSKVEKTPYSPEGIAIVRPSEPLRQMKAFAMGLFQVQDEASQLISHWLSPQPGETLLDACAGPGGKATHMAQLTANKAKILAGDHNPQKLMSLRENARRLGVYITPIRLDITHPLPFKKDLLFDRILLDAPCSGLGTIRRHPEIKWRCSPDKPQRLMDLQLRMLAVLSDYVKAGGILLYSVCTFTLEETVQTIDAFLRNDGRYVLDKGDGKLPAGCDRLIDERGLMLCLPHRHGMDGFFAARLRRMR